MTIGHSTGQSPAHDELEAWEAYWQLRAGNMRYRDQKMEHPHTGRADMVNVASGQTPKICILGCADSRVPPEIIFDQGLGDMFVVRVAGNFADKDNQASLEYAVQHFEPAIIVVLGHEKCGAIEAAAITYDDKSVLPENVKKFNKHHEHSPVSANLKALAEQLRPAIVQTTMNPQPTTDQEYALRLDRAVRRNVIDNVATLQANDVIEKSSTFVIGARYDLDTGEVEWLTREPKGSISEEIERHSIR